MSDIILDIEPDSNVGLDLDLDIDHDTMIKYRSINTAILPEIYNMCHYNKKNNKQSSHNSVWRKFDKNESDNWLISKKFNQSDNDKLYSQFRSILNKLSDKNFNELAQELIDLQISKGEHVVKLVDLIFQKAIIEKKFSTIYSKLSKELSSYYIYEDDNSKPIHFRDILINKCESMFRDCLTPENNPNKILKFKEQIIGCMIFLAELYNNGLLINKIIYSCIMQLILKANLNITINGSHYIIDSICTILTVAGPMFCEDNKQQSMVIFEKLEEIKKSSQLPKKDMFVIMDLLKEKNKWIK